MREKTLLPSSIFGWPKFQKLGGDSQRMWLWLRVNSSCAGVTTVDWLVAGAQLKIGKGKIEELVGELVGAGLLAWDSGTGEVWFLDWFRWECFRGRAWRMLESSIQKIESPKIKKMVLAARPAQPTELVEEGPKSKKLNEKIGKMTRIGTGKL